MRRREQTRGFSLVELLLATGVILILLGIMLPALKRSIRQARRTVCMHQLHVLDQILQMYHNENQGWLPQVGTPEEGLPPGDPGPAWFDLLVPRYTADLAVMVCPEDTYGSLLHVVNPDVPKSKRERACSYGLNQLILANPWGMLANVERFRPRRPLDTLLLADMGPDLPSKKRGLPGLPGGAVGHGCLSWSDGFSYGSVDSRRSWVTQRHACGINISTLGGAIRVVRTKELMNRRIQRYYGACAAGDCPLCLELRVPHYSFHHAQTYWWTGSLTLH